MMDQSQKKYAELRLLICQSEEGSISLEGMQRLNNILLNDPQARQYYREYIHTNVILKSLYTTGKSSFNEPQEYTPGQDYMDIFCELAHYEKTAPEIEIPKEKPQRELIQKVVYPPREKRKVSKFNIIFLAMNAAAILFIVLFIKLAPPKSGVEVATLTDSINAKWADTSDPVQRGTRLYNNKAPLLLREGIIELKFDNKAQVIIEGPAEFQILDDDMIKLNYGQLYSLVPPEAYGFQVSTQHAKIIDLGTEFGIQEKISGDTEVYVLKGKVNLISNVLSKKINVDLLAGSARWLNAATGELKEIQCEDYLFVRQIDSDTNVIWRGQRTIDLADIVGGGNGLGTGEIGKGVSLTNGSCFSDFNWTYGRGKGEYLNVSELPFVDGVIVPDSENGTLQVSSEGHIFNECPNTDGLYYDEIRNGGMIHMTKPESSIPMLFENERYGTSDKPLLFMNSNACITFDLNAIRDLLPGIGITSFQSRCFLFARPNETEVGRTDIFVLIDGKTKYKKIGFDQYGVMLNIDIPLTENNNFLTLVVTDGGDSIAIDWVGFAEPYINLDTD